jgi:hypothetical protein
MIEAMGHCDNPNCPHNGPLQRWETNELVVTVNGVGAAVRSYCNYCLGIVMGGLPSLMPAPEPVTEVTAKGETVVLSADAQAQRAAAEEAHGL